MHIFNELAQKAFAQSNTNLLITKEFTEDKEKKHI